MGPHLSAAYRPGDVTQMVELVNSSAFVDFLITNKKDGFFSVNDAAGTFEIYTFQKDKLMPIMTIHEPSIKWTPPMNIS